jgi:Patatin phospholipase
MPARRSPAADRKVIVHLIYRSRHYEGHSKDYEFSPLTMEDHWRAGYYATRCARCGIKRYLRARAI